jgi:hypothetical protein
MTERSAQKRAMQPNSGSEEDDREMLMRVREAAAIRILFLPHAVNQMNSPDRMIATEEVRAAVFRGIVKDPAPASAAA